MVLLLLTQQKSLSYLLILTPGIHHGMITKSIVPLPLFLLIWLLMMSVLTTASKSNLLVKDILTIAGNFSLNGKFTNLAHYDITTGVWSNTYEPDLYVYGESNGELRATEPRGSMYLHGPCVMSLMCDVFA